MRKIDFRDSEDWLIPTKQVAEFLQCAPDTVKRRSDRDELKREQGDPSAFPPVLYMGRRGSVSFLDLKLYYNHVRAHREENRPDLQIVREGQQKKTVGQQ